MQKIKSITLRNFKFFHGTETQYPETNTITLDSNNLLLFGENGSGKSTIYWALYTFLQSCIKEKDKDVHKYFRAEEAENLRNRFAEDTAPSGIVIHFEDESNRQQTWEITDSIVNTRNQAFIEKTLQASDFINYKYLFKIYDFKNSEPINLFPLFEREILMFIDFEEQYTLHDGSLSGKTYASDWWHFIMTGHKTLPYNKNVVSVSSTEYRRYKDVTIPRFVNLLKNFLLNITETSNEYLAKNFKQQFKIDFDVASITCDYNKYVSQRAKDGILHVPSIPLRVWLINDLLDETKSFVANPHTFMNEARLTALALSIRFAILKQKFLTQATKILVLDDLLISLDMSNRDIVLDLIFTEFKDYQIIMLTHDRLFYSMAEHKIKSLGQTNWKYIEMYPYERDKVPVPLIFESESYLGKAKKYLRDKEYEIAGNLLRNEAEVICNEVLPDKYRLNSEGGRKNLSTLISACIEYFERNGLDNTLFKELNTHREFVLNPSSHHSFEVPKFDSEIRKCITTIEGLKKIRVRKQVFEKEEVLTFTLKTPEPNAEEWKCNIIIYDDFRIVVMDGKEPVLTKGMVNFSIYKDNEIQPDKDGKELRHEIASMKTFYENWYGKSDQTAPQNFWDGIKYQKDGKSLREILLT